MFKVTSRPQFRHKIEVMVPTDGGHTKQTVDVTYVVLDSGSDQTDHDLTTTDGQLSFCRQAVVQLDDLVDENDQAVSYSDGLREQLIRLPYVRAALCRGYIAAVSKVAVGN